MVTRSGGNEFHGDDQGLDGTVSGVTHEEIALGAVLDVAGATDVASTSFDPLATLRVQGLIWFADGDGAERSLRPKFDQSLFLHPAVNPAGRRGLRGVCRRRRNGA